MQLHELTKMAFGIESKDEYTAPVKRRLTIAQRKRRAKNKVASKSRKVNRK